MASSSTSTFFSLWKCWHGQLMLTALKSMLWWGAKFSPHAHTASLCIWILIFGEREKERGGWMSPGWFGWGFWLCEQINLPLTFMKNYLSGPLRDCRGSSQTSKNTQPLKTCGHLDFWIVANFWWNETSCKRDSTLLSSLSSKTG